MKKAFLLVLSMVLVLAISACSSNTTSNNSNSSNTQGPAAAGNSPTGNESSQAVSTLIDWIEDGSYSFDFELTSEGGGKAFKSTGSMAMDGGNVAIKTVTEEASAWIIIKDGATYMIVDEQKMMIKMANAGPDVTSGIVTDYTDIKKAGSGTGEINGKKLPYEEYESEGAKVKFYMEGGQVYGIESENEGFKSVMIISNPSNKAPAGVFDLPEGYRLMQM